MSNSILPWWVKAGVVLFFVALIMMAVARFMVDKANAQERRDLERRVEALERPR